MAIDINKIIEDADNVLKAQKLYTDITFKEIDETSTSYDPITGTFATNKITTHSFEAVVLTESNTNKPGNEYGVTLNLIIMPNRITFELEIDQIFTIGSVNWQIVSFETAPLDAIHTVSLRRK